ncbi:DUF484 family protein [Saccharospirillum impatiens]|uniref:DUF484 family protein n=1 Tax=Saccharospirillum impatiens TaxID=169438 RepID=UPI0003FBA733|nr:DUF484 family protein [Saccharospirillum impatiens]
MTESVNTETLDLDAMVTYLRHHPRFFEDHPNLLKKLHLRHESGDAISLIERQNQILRQENRQLIDRLNQFIQVAQRNDRLFLKLQRLILELLPETRLNGLLERLQQGLQRDFDVHETTVILFNHAPGDGDGWLQTSRAQIAEAFPAVIDQGKAVCGALEPSLTQLLFANADVGSIALAPLTQGQEVVGVLALGHSSAEHFRSGTETLFLTHLAQVTSLQMDRAD